MPDRSGSPVSPSANLRANGQNKISYRSQWTFCDLARGDLGPDYIHAHERVAIRTVLEHLSATASVRRRGLNQLRNAPGAV